VLGQVFLGVGIAVVGGGAEIVAEIGVRISEEDREVVLAVDMDEDRLIVGDELGNSVTKNRTRKIQSDQ
jgi:hypothetical protein